MTPHQPLRRRLATPSAPPEKYRGKPWRSRWVLTLLLLAVAPVSALAEPLTFKVLSYSRATFKTEAPLETVIGNTSGPGVSGSVTGDPARPQGATGTIRVDLTTVKTGIDRRDAQMLGKEFLDTQNGENRFAVFDLKEVGIDGPLDPGKEMTAKLWGTLTIKGRPVEITADARITYLKLTPEQLETQKRFGFTSDNMRVTARFRTSFTNHGMQVPQVLFLKLSNDIQLEVDLTMARQ